MTPGIAGQEGMKKTFNGSCHCGAVRFECEVDLAQGTSKCNCSICTKARFWKVIVKADAFRLEQGVEALSDYQFGSMLQWGVEKFVVPHNTNAIWGYFYARAFALIMPSAS